MKACEFTLQQVADALDAKLVGNPERIVCGIQTLEKADSTQLAFLSNSLYQSQLADTHAAAVILSPEDADNCPVDAIVLDNPYLGYARISHWFNSKPKPKASVHPSSVVAENAVVDPSVSIAANVVIEADAVIGKNVVLGANCYIGQGVKIGDESELAANVSVYHDCIVGKRAIIHSAAVIGSDGFGFASSQGKWEKIAQIGKVVLGDDVEVGAGTTIDRGALGDTTVANGVKLDNQIQVAHNVEIGENTAIAGCVGIAGSTKIGRHCAIGGGAVVLGHLKVTDGVQIMASTVVTKSITKSGVYTSGTGMLPHQQWKRNVVRFRQLDKLANRVALLEKKFEERNDS